MKQYINSASRVLGRRGLQYQTNFNTQFIRSKTTLQAATSERDIKISGFEKDSNKDLISPSVSHNPPKPTKGKLEQGSSINQLDELFSVIPSGTWRDTQNPSDIVIPEPASNTFRLRTMGDSWLDIRLNFKDDPELVKRYEGAYGEIQIGKIMEDLDRLAAGVAYKYCDEVVMFSRVTIVTASVDRLELLGHINPEKNYRLGGYVTYVGFSSLEVFIQMDEVSADGSVCPPPITIPNPPKKCSTEKEPILIAKFTMVALDKYSKKAFQLHPLLVQGSREKALFNVGLASKARKMASSQRSLDKKPPTAEERLIIHDMYLESLKYIKNDIPLPANTRWMDSTQLQSVLICQPQDRNVHNFIFGGFLMRLAYNLSWATGYSYLKIPPEFVASDEIQFRKSVPVGSILTLTSKVCYTPNSYSLKSEEDPATFQVSVQAYTQAPGLKEPGLTNTFRFTFRTPDQIASPVPHLLARSYAEFIEFLEARRRSREDNP